MVEIDKRLRDCVPVKRVKIIRKVIWECFDHNHEHETQEDAYHCMTQRTVQATMKGRLKPKSYKMTKKRVRKPRAERVSIGEVSEAEWNQAARSVFGDERSEAPFPDENDDALIEEDEWADEPDDRERHRDQTDRFLEEFDDDIPF